MLYFKYKISFKKAGSLTDLIEKQGITSIIDEDNLVKRLTKGENIYAFLSPFHFEIDQAKILDWGSTEEEAWENFHHGQEEI